MKRLTKPGCLSILIVIILMALIGCAGGPIGAALLGIEKPTGLIGGPRPHIHLPGSELTTIKESPSAIMNFALRDTMLTAMLVSLALILITWFAARKISLVPKGMQNMMEMIVEFFVNLVSGVTGKEFAYRVFPLIMTLFVFIICSNYIGLLPFVESVGIVKAGYEEHYNKIMIGGINIFYTTMGAKEAELEGYIPFLRPATTDLNIPLSCAIIGMFMVQVWGIQAAGVRRFLARYFPTRNLLKGKIFTGIIDLVVGVFELLSQVLQIISLTFRLFGNIFAGHVLITIFLFLFPLLWVVPIYGLELIVGLVQAFILPMLVLIFAGLAIAAAHEH